MNIQTHMYMCAYLSMRVCLCMCGEKERVCVIVGWVMYTATRGERSTPWRRPQCNMPSAAGRVDRGEVAKVKADSISLALLVLRDLFGRPSPSNALLLMTTACCLSSLSQDMVQTWATGHVVG